MTQHPIVDLRHVTVSRGEQIVLQIANLRVNTGEHLVILGPNGCGKSTLLKTLTCELYPIPRPETRLHLFGRSRWDVTELRRRMGIVTPDLPGEATKYVTGLEAVLTGFFSSSRLWPNLNVTDAMRDKAEEVLSRVDGVNLREKRVGEMSAGQQRRVMIARALAGIGEGPQVLLLDEPSNALDLSAQHGLRETLSGLAQQGTTILMITHHVSDIIPEMKRVVFMQSGRIIADGTREKLLTPGGLSELFNRRVRVIEEAGFLFAW